MIRAGRSGLVRSGAPSEPEGWQQSPLREDVERTRLSGIEGQPGLIFGLRTSPSGLVREQNRDDAVVTGATAHRARIAVDDHVAAAVERHCGVLPVLSSERNVGAASDSFAAARHAGQRLASPNNRSSATDGIAVTPGRATPSATSRSVETTTT